MHIRDFDFELPEALIAKRQLEPRDASKLLICKSPGRLGNFQNPFVLSDLKFNQILNELGDGDWLVVNNAKVLPVRILGRRVEGGGNVEAVLLRPLEDLRWVAIMKLSAKVKPGLEIIFEPGVIATVESTHEERIATEGEVVLSFSGISLSRISFETWLTRHGHIPLPPYIGRDDDEQDKKDYQTVYAKKIGSAAAPTAGLHFTQELLTSLREKGVIVSDITLNVGVGTFRPMKVEKIEDHVMHKETFEISKDFARDFSLYRGRGQGQGQKQRRLVAVGTTVVRTLESWVKKCTDKSILPGSDESIGVFETDIFITPGFQFSAVDDLITNFHLPKSTLLVLVAGAVGVESFRKIYSHAIESRYRFFSYGDAMFIRGK